ncbi:Arc family DNA-binding protein [Mariniphaga sediminis]|nr:Arc family DNA-binding protein [Mariniphaga sediminis]
MNVRKKEEEMPKKKTFVLRINPEMMEAVEKWAADDFRSINGQLEWIIHKALKDAKRLKKNNEE